MTVIQDRYTNRQIKQAAWFLFLVTAPLAEILSGNLPVLSFFEPFTLIMVTLSYGVPVLLIRELATARKMNVTGIMILGLAYGILNEGVLAKTLTLPGGEPVGDFAGYGQIGAFQSGWATVIIAWHALHSVLYPILLAHWFFPAARNHRWLNRRWTKILLVILVVLYSLYFINPARREPDIFILYIAATAFLIWLALHFSKTHETISDHSRISFKPAFFGASAICFYIFQFSAPHHISFIFFFGLSLLIVISALWGMGRAGWRPLPEVLLFGLGDELTFSFFVVLISIASGHRPIEIGIAGLVFFVVFFWLIRAIRKYPAGRKTASGFNPFN